VTLRITDRAVEHLAGRPLVLRASPRHGCCGGSAAVPVAEVGPPADPEGYLPAQVGDVEVHVDPLLGPTGSWVVDVDGLWRWARLRVDGAAMCQADRRAQRP
jgi:hypothetical protein